jgi:hypothetical protein
VDVMIEANNSMIAARITDQMERELIALQDKTQLEYEQLHYLAKVASNPLDFIRLVKLVGYLKNKALQKFMVALLNDRNRITKFITLPASKAHHHHQAGGLLAHSLEVTQLCFQLLKNLSGISANERELTLCAGLLHDFGKTITMTAQNSYTSMGYSVSHDELTLASLEPYFSQLTQDWSEGAATLAYLLTWNYQKGNAKYATAVLVKSADQISAAVQRRNEVFSDKPNHHHYVSKPGEGVVMRV